MKGTISRSVSAAAVALLAVAAACSDAREPLSPKLQAWNQPPPNGRLTGTGEIDPINDIVGFAFDVKADQNGITGRFAGEESAQQATLVTDPAADAATSFTAFRSSSTFCSPSSRGAEFDAIGHLVEPMVDVYVSYTVKACDNGLGALHMDTFSIDIPSRGFHRDGTVTGDIVKQ